MSDTPFAACTIDFTGCDHMSRDIEVIERIAAAGSKGPTEVTYLYAGAAPKRTPCSILGWPERLLAAAEEVLAGLHARIDAADKRAVPVFHGIVDLSDAIHEARAALSATATEGE